MKQVSGHTTWSGTMLGGNMQRMSLGNSKASQGPEKVIKIIISFTMLNQNQTTSQLRVMNTNICRGSGFYIKTSRNSQAI